MTELNYSSPPYKSSGKNCSNRIVRFISPVPAEECVVQVQNNNFADYKGRTAKMKVLMRADTHKHINVIKEEDEDPKEYKCNASQVGGYFFFPSIFAHDLLRRAWSSALKSHIVKLIDASVKNA